MKKWLRIGALGVAVAFLTLRSFGVIENTHHDFSSAGWTGGEICIVCHTPHGADTTVSDAPLWNHEVTTAAYTVYASATLDAVPGQPNGVSKLCLSCHDGTVAIDSFGDNPGSYTAGFGNIGTDLTRHHPISFPYDSALATQDGELFDPNVQPSGLGGTISVDMLRNGQMECTSCHDVHVSRKSSSACSGCHFVGPAGSTVTLSLWKSNAMSALCLTCHDK